MLIMKINLYEVIYILSFLKLRLYKSCIIKDNRFVGLKMKSCGVVVIIFLLYGWKSYYFFKIVDNCLLWDMCDVIFYFYNFKDF